MHWFSQRSNAERSALPRLLTVLLVAGSVGLGLTGCYVDQASGDPGIAVTGVWEIIGTDWDGDGNDNVERWTITSDTISYESSTDGTSFTTTYRAEVVDFVNGSLNAGDTALAGGAAAAINPGFAIMKYTEVDGAGTGEVGKYNIFRWAQTAGNTTKRDFTQGSKDADLDGDGDPFTGTYVNLVFDTPSAAETGATTTNGYFGLASSGAERVQQ